MTKQHRIAADHLENIKKIVRLYEEARESNCFSDMSSALEKIHKEAIQITHTKKEGSNQFQIFVHTTKAGVQICGEFENRINVKSVSLRYAESALDFMWSVYPTTEEDEIALSKFVELAFREV